MEFKDFEIRPYNEKKYELVKWKYHDPIELTDAKTGEKILSTKNCFTVAMIEWDDKEPCWEFRSVGTRFLKYYENGLSEYILKWLELHDLCEEYEKEDFFENF